MARGGKKPGAASSAKAPRKNDNQKSPQGTPTPTREGLVTTALQQQCLNIFRDALKPSSGDSAIIQEVKGHLFDRNFNEAFGKEEYLRVYASRWSPSRALGYLQILDSLRGHLLSRERLSSGCENDNPFRAVCLGGGAGGELAAVAGWLNAMATAQSTTNPPNSVHVDLVDVAEWSEVTKDLHQAITTPPELSQYASQAAKDANRSLLQPEQISVAFHHVDALETAKSAALAELFAKADVITCMFTLNELYSTSIPKTQQLLSNLTESIRPGSCLLIVDSPGSYATVSINGSEKKYPMQWLLDYTLRGTSSKQNDESNAKWQRLESVDSQWFRIPSNLHYPIELENMRYQIHLYARLADTGE